MKVDIKDYIAGSYTQQYHYKSFIPSKINQEQDAKVSRNPM